MYPSGITFADISTFSAPFQHILRKKSEKNVTWRHMTSRDPILIKFYKNLSFHNILPLGKFQVNWMIFAEVMTINVFFQFNVAI